MHFEYYSDLTPAKCASAIKDRIAQPETGSRPAIAGWVDKDGFSITVTTPVIGKFRRSTGMKATFQRDKGTTVISGYVSTGADRKQQLAVFIGMIIVGIALIALRMFPHGVIVMLIGAGLYIPLEGDRKNSDYLVKQIRSILSAKTRDPR